MLLNRRYKFVFIHIPKTAGMSIRAAFTRLEGLDNAAVNTKTWHETVLEFLMQYQARSGQTLDSLKDYRFLAFVRNPWDRMRSLHCYLLLYHSKRLPELPHSLNDFVAMLDAPPAWMQTIRSLRRKATILRGSTRLSAL